MDVNAIVRIVEPCLLASLLRRANAVDRFGSVIPGCTSVVKSLYEMEQVG